LLPPRTVTERLLANAWKLAEGEEEFTFLRTVVKGSDPAGSARTYEFQLLDRTDPKAGSTSMARTTGFPCAAAAAMLARGQYRDPGVRPPEMLARDEIASRHFLDALRGHGLSWTERWSDT